MKQQITKNTLVYQANVYYTNHIVEIEMQDVYYLLRKKFV